MALTVCFIKETEDFVSVKTSDPSDVKMSCVSSHDFWLENMEKNSVYVAGRRDTEMVFYL
jgi:hypothetical protein